MCASGIFYLYYYIVFYTMLHIYFFYSDRLQMNPPSDITIFIVLYHIIYTCLKEKYCQNEYSLHNLGKCSNSKKKLFANKQKFKQ